MIISQTDTAAMRLRDRLHNGQPKPNAPPSAGRRSEALEGMR